MDLSFSPSLADDATPIADIALLMALVEGRAAASATARAQAALHGIDACVLAADPPLAPAGGAFNAGMASMLVAWAQS